MRSNLVINVMSSSPLTKLSSLANFPLLDVEPLFKLIESILFLASLTSRSNASLTSTLAFKSFFVLSRMVLLTLKPVGDPFLLVDSS